MWRQFLVDFLLPTFGSLFDVVMHRREFALFTVIWYVPSVLWRCWLGSRKGIRPVKNWVVGYWHGYLAYTGYWHGYAMQVLERGADLHMAQRMPLPLTVSCFSTIQIGFSFLVPARPGSPGQRAVKRACVCVCVCVCVYCDLIVEWSGVWWWIQLSHWFSSVVSFSASTLLVGWQEACFVQFISTCLISPKFFSRSNGGR